MQAEHSRRQAQNALGALLVLVVLAALMGVDLVRGSHSTQVHGSGVRRPAHVIAPLAPPPTSAARADTTVLSDEHDLNPPTQPATGGGAPTPSPAPADRTRLRRR